MNPVSALLGRGPEGLPPPAPLDFGSLVLPRSPNAALAAPPGHPVAARAHLPSPIYPVPAERLFETLLVLVDGFPRCHRLGAWPERHQAQWVERTRWMNFPDLVWAEAVPLPEGSGLLLLSRSLFGWSDLGVNRARAARWLEALEVAVR
ncbi:DUF1499 domain-containing protein [Sabulicella glaciei]|uniref:DUF1499 domain-containing protein n=1 Tax=Sabulicella glaciei TaxID=2984948 RepID=A0ABT3NTC8_9PROT|nr:DUF1499 domain-containing protein [Roseococcus sp. MDT2-1-1]MCW8085416.1 DUF1499 domain-containing protein [Roseococcus sp. MDT2-1-1]